MPRLTAQRRLSIMSRAVGLAEDRAATGEGSVPLGEIAEALKESVDDVKESLVPLGWVEFEVPGGIIDLLGAVTLEDERLIVEHGWWRRLARMSPPEAARLYVKAAAAASLESEVAMPLKSAMRKLRGVVGEITVLEESPSRMVDDLRAARGSGYEVMVSVEGHEKTIVTSASRFFVIAVFRDRDEWKVTLEARDAVSESEVRPGSVITIPVERIFAVIPAPSAPSRPESAPSTIDPEHNLTVTLEYPATSDWVLDPLETIDFAKLDDDRLRSTIRSWGSAELKTLLLRLGPQAVVIDPPEFVGLQSAVAAEVLALYSNG